MTRQAAESKKSGPDSPGKGELAEKLPGLKFSLEGKMFPISSVHCRLSPSGCFSQLERSLQVFLQSNF